MITVMFPILARYGALFIYSYTVMMALGIVAGIGITIWATRNQDRPGWFDALLIVLFAGIMGGRTGFVLHHWGYFQQRPFEAWQIWQGGLSYHGALIAALLALLFWSVWRGFSFFDYAALLAPAFALVTVFGWAACWLDGCAYGRQTTLGPLSANLADEFGVFAVRYHSQFVGIILALVATLLIVTLRNRRSPALIFWYTLASLSLVHLLAGLLRGDPALQIGILRLDNLLDFLLVIISLLLLQYERSKDKHDGARS